MNRIKKRRRPELSGVFSYLQTSHDSYNKIKDQKNGFSLYKNDFIKKEIIKIIENTK